MTLRSYARIVASCVLVLSFYGCVTVEREAAPTGKAEARGITGQVTIQKENNHCTWTFDQAPGSAHKIVKGTLDVRAKPGHECGKYESGDQLFIGDSPANMKKILATPDGDFVTEGTCRYCYFNASGGMSCVTYPGC
jgi:hypothetical protein